MKQIEKIILSGLIILTGMFNPITIRAEGDTQETFYGYQEATYTIKDVHTDSKEETYLPWYRKVYKYNYDYKEVHSSTDFTIRDTAAKSGVVWSMRLDGYHLTKFVSDIDMCRKNNWTNYYQPKVEIRDDNGVMFVGQNRNSNVQVNGTWTGDAVIHGTLSMYAYGETGSGRNWTGAGGSNYIEYYQISSKVSDWVFDASEIRSATTINSVNEEGYVLPTWSESKGWRSVTAYEPDTYTRPVSMIVHYDANGGTGTMKLNTTSKAELSENGYVRAGYTFDGWNTKADGSGTRIADRANISRLSPLEGKEVTLYAQWKPSQYTVSFDPNGGTGTMEDAIIGFDTLSPLPKNQYIRTGYVFDKWNTAEDGSGVSYSDQASVKNLASYTSPSVTLYAMWKDIEPPIITITDYAPPVYNADGTINYVNTNVIVTFKVTDSGSGLSKIELVHDSNTVAVLAAFNGTKTAVLQYTVSGRMLERDNWQLKATDMAGNVSYQKLVIPNIDKQKPTIDESDGNLRCRMSVNGAGAVVLKVADDYSGVKEWSYKVSYIDMFNEMQEGTWVSGDASLSAQITIRDSTIANVAVKVTDNAGNTNEISSCPVSFSKVYTASVTLSDYDYVFGLYNSLYGKGTEVSDLIAGSFLTYLSNDRNETSKSALRYMQTLILNGASKKESLKSFMKTFRYDRH